MPAAERTLVEWASLMENTLCPSCFSPGPHGAVLAQNCPITQSPGKEGKPFSLAGAGGASNII